MFIIFIIEYNNIYLNKMNPMKFSPLLLFPLALLLTACPSDKPADQPTTISNHSTTNALMIPVFSADSAYALTAKQVAFGPRVPNRSAHVNCGNYLAATLRSYGLKVLEQPFEAKTFDGHTIQGRNIIAQFQPEMVRRVAIFAHWDTRPFADHDTLHKNAPMDGASDGASAVATALEIVRVLSRQPIDARPAMGVDVFLLDAEDSGYEQETQSELKNQVDESNGRSSWCLGSQYWAAHLLPANYRAEYGVLLDMVGAKNGHFTREYNSRQNALGVVDKIWNTATKIGYSDFFLYKDTDAIIDDHVYTTQAGVPTVDIYDHPPYGMEPFPAYHHTTADNMDVIDRKTLKAVGQTMLNLLYSE